MSIPATVVYFVGYDALRARIGHSRILFRSAETAQKWSPLYAGVVARITAATLISPIELVRTRVQSRRDLSLGRVLVSTRELVGAEGVRALYRGLTPTLWRDVPFSGVYWFGYDMLKRTFSVMLQKRNGRKHLLVKEEFGLSFLSGSLSGSVGSFLVILCVTIIG